MEQNVTFTYIRQKHIYKQFYYLGAKSWNILPQSLRHVETANQFISLLKNKLLECINTDSCYMVNNAFDFIYKAYEET